MKKPDKNIAIVGTILVAITIAMGAFGAHGLKEYISEKALMTFETGVRYQMYHSIGIVFIGLATPLPSGLKKATFLFLFIGIILFSGSIYLLALNEILPFDSAKIGFVTPLGGLLFLLGWLRLAYGLVKLK